MSAPVNVVIGGASGMGKAIVQLLARRGKLIVADVNKSAADVVAQEVGAQAVRCDLLDEDSIDALVAKTGKLGTLVVTAGLSPSMADGTRIFNVNLPGMAYVLEAFQKIISPDSVAVCFASIAGHLFVPTDSHVLKLIDDPLSPTIVQDLIDVGVDIRDSATAYGYSKHGVIRLCKRKAAKWGECGARIISVSPGIVDTAMGDLEFRNQPAMKDMVAATPLKRVGRAGEIAAAVDFLTSSKASFITGIDLLVDGGIVSTI
jgi:NAD(P)-dependent dehydrogenase (short-subunit alcohol dehydrogenase family)